MKKSIVNLVLKQKEKQELEKLEYQYKTKPIGRCPICRRKSWFIKNDQGQILCLRCEKIVKVE